LGQDAFVLATLGCKVILIEQSGIIHALLEDGFARAEMDKTISPIINRMSLAPANTIDYLQKLTPDQYPDAVYLDPMYPHRGKSALSKKEMQSFQKLLGADQQGTEMLQISRQRVLKRVAVKRSVKAPFLGDANPDFQILCPKIRFDIYLA
jgi:16S rRNA (guanine1516-N2)-methyltransferase